MMCEDAMGLLGSDASPHRIVEAERHVEGCDRCRKDRARRAEAEAWVATLEIPEDPPRVSEELRRITLEVQRERVQQDERDEESPFGSLVSILDSFVLAGQWMVSGEGTCPDCWEEHGSRPAHCPGCRRRARRTARAAMTPPLVMRGAAVGFGALLSAALLAHSARTPPVPDPISSPPPAKVVTSVKIPESPLASVIAFNPPTFEPIVPPPKDEDARDAYNEAYQAAHGLGEDPAPVKVFKLLSLSADKGFSEALYQLGHCFYEGYGTEKNEMIAVKHFLLAAEAGHPWAEFRIGVAFSKGAGVPPDPVQARYWLEQALLGGVLEAVPHLLAMHDMKTGGPFDDRLVAELEKLPEPDPDSPARKFALPIWEQELAEKFKGK